MAENAITRQSLNIKALSKAQGHKYDHGHALVLSGGAGQTGAARLAARGALRIGAGAVTLGVPPSAQLEVAMHISALMLRRIAGPDAVRAVLEDHRISALCIGPGLGLKEDKAGLIEVAVQSKRPCVLDADALTHAAQRPELMKAVHGRCVLTPHGGEFARLFPELAQRMQEDGAFSKVDATRAAAAKTGGVVLFKGIETVIADPKGQVHIHAAVGDRAVPWLATAGAGDVLAGLITGLLARGFPPLEAATHGTFLHVEAARSFGPGLIAEDLIEEIPRVLKNLGC